MSNDFRIRIKDFFRWYLNDAVDYISDEINDNELYLDNDILEYVRTHWEEEHTIISSQDPNNGNYWNTFLNDDKEIVFDIMSIDVYPHWGH